MGGVSPRFGRSRRAVRRRGLTRQVSLRLEYVARRLRCPDPLGLACPKTGGRASRMAGRCVALAFADRFEAALHIRSSCGWPGWSDPGLIRDMSTLTPACCANGGVPPRRGCELRFVLLFDDLANRRSRSFPQSYRRSRPDRPSPGDTFHRLGCRSLYSGVHLRLLCSETSSTWDGRLGPLKSRRG